MDISALETMNAIAKRHGDEATVRESQWLADRVQANELTVLVAGQFKRGKSTFLNALVGQDLLPTGVLPLTSVPTMIHYGLVPQAMVSFRDGGSMKIALEDIGSYVTEAENPDNRLRVARVDVETPLELLEGMRLVDTPGIASTFLHNTETARDSLREADLAILVVSPEPPIGDAEIRFAKEVREAAERLFVVYNKADTLAEQEHELVEFTKKQLEKALGFAPQVFVLSAKEALRARKAGADDPRFGSFLREFRRFIDGHRDTIRERSMVRKRASLGERLGLMLRLKRHALLLPMEERRDLRRRFEQIANEVRRRADDLGIQIELAMRGCARRIDDLLEALLQRSSRTLGSRLSEAAETGNSTAFESDLEAAAAREASCWLMDVAQTIDTQMRETVEMVLTRVAELEREIVRLGLEAVNVHETIPQAELEAFDLPGISLPKERIVDTGLEIVVRGGTNLLPRVLRAQILRQRLTVGVRERLDARRGRLRYAAHRELDRIARELIVSAQRRLTAAEAAVRSALDEAASVDDSAIYQRAADLEREELNVRRLAAS